MIICIYADQSLQDLIKKTGARLYWDSTLKRGYLVRGDHKVMFWVGNREIFLGKKIFYGNIFVEHHQVFFDDNTSKQIQDYFSRSQEISSDTDLGIIDKDQIESRKKSNRKKQQKRNFFHEIAVILIDPGHGGKDTGAIGQHRDMVVREKDVTLVVGIELENLLKKKYPHKTILMTRRTDTYKSLEERVDMPRQSLKLGQAEIYISIHANSTLAKPKTAKGFEVWCLPETFERKIFDHVQIEDFNLRTVLDKVVQEEYLAESEHLARSLVSSMDKGIGNITTNRGIRRGEWFVVRHAQMAAVLVELGFLTHPKESRYLADRSYLKKLGRLLYNGVVRFTEYFEQRQ